MPLVVAYSTIDTGSATPGVDFVAVPVANVTFPPGSTSQNVTVQLWGDTLLEGNEFFGASFQLIFNDTVQSNATANITILDDDVSVRAIMGGVGVWAGRPATQGGRPLAGADRLSASIMAWLTFNLAPALITPVVGQHLARQPVCLGGRHWQHDDGGLQRQRQQRAGEGAPGRQPALGTDVVEQ